MQELNNLNLKVEIWSPIPGYESTYQASSLGRIKRVTSKVRHNKGGYKVCSERILKPMINRGYQSVMLSSDNIQKIWKVHRLVALTFISNPLNRPYINHKNGIRSDNRIDNLEWCNNSENQIHAYRHLGKKNPKASLGRTGRLCKNSKPVLQINDSGQIVKEWDAIADACRVLSCSQASISRSCAKGYKTKGFYWIFKPSI